MKTWIVKVNNADAAETMGLLLELYGHEVRIARDHGGLGVHRHRHPCFGLGIRREVFNRLPIL